MSAPAHIDGSLHSVADAAGCEVDAGTADALARFAGAVSAWGARTDLTSLQTPEALAEVLFLDAMVLADRALVPQGTRLVDVGAGAGAPALPLTLLRPDVDVTLVEPRRRRVTFVRSAIGQLALQGRARVWEGRVTSTDPFVPGAPFDVAISRATFQLETWLPLGAGLASRVAALTTGPVQPPDGFEQVARRDYRVPSTGAPRTITVYCPRPGTSAARGPE